jgi:hypothetical protein
MESLLGLAFVAGLYGFGGWQAGLVCSAALLALVCLP